MAGVLVIWVRRSGSFPAFLTLADGSLFSDNGVRLSAVALKVTETTRSPGTSGPSGLPLVKWWLSA